jgi:hypothetical protein
MFPARYFAPRYFAPRYFAKSGVEPPAVLGQLRVYINGKEKTNAIWYGGTSSFNLLRGQRGTCALPLIVEPDEAFAPQVGQTIDIYDPEDTRVWCGFVEAVGIKWLGDDGWHVITLTGVSLESLFDTAEFDRRKFTGVTCGAAVTTIFTDSGIDAGITLGTISDGPTVESLEVTNLAQALDSLATIAGFIWYVDPADKKLYFHSAVARAAAWEMASENILWESIEWQQSRADFRTSQVIQLPGVALTPVTATYTGDGATTTFVLPTTPEYILSIDISTGKTGKTISWSPGTSSVHITPAPPDGSSIVVKYADTGAVAVSTTSPGIGDRTARYSRTRTFTPAGGLQEATALLARYSMLPATLVVSTDKPGICIGRLLTIAVTDPSGATVLLSGNWTVQEVEGAIVTGLDQKDEPYGHFRYRLHLVNTAATAVFQGDGSTTIFLLPSIPASVPSMRTDALDRTLDWHSGTDEVEVTPPLEEGDTLAVDMVDASNVPDVPTFVETWEDIADGTGGAPATILGADATAEAQDPATFKRDLTIYDSTVRDDAAPHTTVYHDGTAFRLLAVLRVEITADYTVRINKAGSELITVTVPSSTAVDEVLEWSLAQGSPPVLGPFFDKEVLTTDILESDGQIVDDGILQLTVQWNKS